TILPGETRGETQPARTVLVAGDLAGVRRLPILEGEWLPAFDRVFPGAVVLNQAARDQHGGVGTRLWMVTNAPPRVRVPPSHRSVVGVINDGRGEPRAYQSMHSMLHMFPSITADFGELELLVHYPGATPTEIQARIEEVAQALGVPDASVDM